MPLLAFAWLTNARNTAPTKVCIGLGLQGSVIRNQSNKVSAINEIVKT